MSKIRARSAHTVCALIGMMGAVDAGAQGYTYAFQFGGPGAANGQFSHMNGIALVPGTNHLLATDGTRNDVQVFNTAGVYLDKFGGSGSGNGQLSYPAGVRVDPGSGNILVADYNNTRVQMFGPQGNYISQFGDDGGTGQFSYPCDVAVDPVTRNRIVPDGWGARVKVFGVGGNYLSQFGSAGTQGGQFGYACNIVIDPQNGHILVDDETNHNVQVFNASGAYLGRFGGNGSAPGQFSVPAGMTIDAVNRNVLVADYGNNRVQVFAPNGTFLTQFGSVGSTPGHFSAPVAVASDPLSHRVFVGERGNSRVQVFEPSASTDPCGATVVSLSVAPLTAEVNQSLLFSARASIHSPFTGTVSFVVDGGAATCTASMRDVSALCTGLLQPGSHSIVAHYSGDGINAPGCSAPQLVNVVAQTTGDPTAVGCSVVPNPIVQGQPTRVVCDVSGAVNRPLGIAGIDGGVGGATGYVTVKQGEAVVAQLPLEYAEAGYTTRFSGGSHPITVTYSGDSANEPSTTSLPIAVTTPADDIFYGDFELPPVD